MRAFFILLLIATLSFETNAIADDEGLDFYQSKITDLLGELRFEEMIQAFEEARSKEIVFPPEFDFYEAYALLGIDDRLAARKKFESFVAGATGRAKRGGEYKFALENIETIKGEGAAKPVARKPTSEILSQIESNMVTISPGSFVMGEINEKGFTNEKPAHEVTIGYQFQVSKYEVSQDIWQSVMGYNQSAVRGDNHPVDNVAWYRAQVFLEKLNKLAGLTGKKKYRLLTEAEWEYVARAGTQTNFSWGDAIGKNNANCGECGSQWDNKGSAPVGSFKPNPWGLFDMSGNVSEWVQDCWSKNYSAVPADGSAFENKYCSKRVVRGASSGISGIMHLRVSNRSDGKAQSLNAQRGFRIARGM